MAQLRLGHILNEPCPDCGAKLILKQSKEYGLFYGCTEYPKCKTTHAAHKSTGQPMGIPANRETRYWRVQAHDIFDKIWLGPERIVEERQDAYILMQNMMGLSVDNAHISKFNTEQCKELITKCEGLFQWMQE
jgi:ssDNA-binding Zn-finger/Zn-ribbon topoisomerase 1